MLENRITDTHAALMVALTLVDVSLDPEDGQDSVDALRKVMVSNVPIMFKILGLHKRHRTLVSFLLSVFNNLAFHTDGVKAIDTDEHFGLLLSIYDMYQDDAKLMETLFATFSCLAVDSSTCSCPSFSFSHSDVSFSQKHSESDSGVVMDFFEPWQQPLDSQPKLPFSRTLLEPCGQ